MWIGLTSWSPSADLQFGGRSKSILRNGQVLWSRAPSNASGRVVLRTVAMAQPAAEIAFIDRRRAAEMGANADQHVPLGPLHPIGIRRGRTGGKPRVARIGIGKLVRIDCARVRNLLRRAPPHEEWVAPPPEDDLLADRNRGDVDLHRREGEDRRAGVHLVDK